MSAGGRAGGDRRARCPLAGRAASALTAVTAPIVRSGRPRVVALGLVVAAGLGPAAVASAAWSAPGAGAAAAGAATMPNGAAPSGSASGEAVTISWPAASLSNGTPVAGYVIHRYDALNGGEATVGAGCSGVVTGTSCTEAAVPPGSWIYTDTPVQLSWSGGESPPSSVITVTGSVLAAG